MYLKTTSPQFLKYGAVFDTPSSYQTKRLVIEYKKSYILTTYDYPVSFSVLEGIAVIAVQNEFDVLEEYVIHRRAVLNKNTPFMIIPLTQSALIEMSVETKKNYKEKTTKIAEPFNHVPIRPQFFITDIFSYYYNVKGQNYSFSGESHLFWELTYVDTGSLLTTIEGETFELKNQDLILYFPNQYHDQRIDVSNTCSYLTIMFDMRINANDVDRLKNRIFHCSQPMYTLIGNFIKQSNLLETYDMPYSRDLMVSYLQELIILMIQYDTDISVPITLNNPAQSKFESEMINEIVAYIHKKVYEPISVEDICNNFGVSRSTLQVLFKRHINKPPKQYINDLKLEKAQQLIYEENLPITEIAIKLGFSSIHYFSRKFKKEYGLSPSEYAQSVFKKKPQE